MKWIKTVKRPYPPFYTSLMFEAWLDQELWFPYLGFGYALDGTIKVADCWFYPESHMKDFAQRLAQHLFSDQSNFEKLKAESLKNEKPLIDSVQTDFPSFCAAFKRQVIAIQIYFIIDDLIEEKIRSLLAQKTSPENVNKIMEKLSTPFEDNFYKLEKLSLLKNDFKTHLQEFAWINSRYGEKVEYTPEHAEELRQELIKEDYFKKHQEEKASLKQAIEQAKSLLSQDAFLIDLMQFFIFYRTQRTDITNKAIFLAQDLVQKEAQKFGLTYQDFLQCSYQEIIEKNIPSQEIIAERKKSHTVYVTLGSRPKVMIGQENQKMVEQYLPANAYVDEIKGRAAYLGKIQGLVVLVHNKEDLHKVKEGSILVTSMTTPEMVLAMGKAAAFVTDEGGITCHAAILAREMKKPCLTGTQNATKIFKDGDLVEVDTEKGLVRKIK